MVSYLRAHIYLLSVLEFFLMSVDSLQERKKTNKKVPINECWIMLFGALCFVSAFIHIYLQLFGRKPTVKMGIVCIFYIFKFCCA